MFKNYEEVRHFDIKKQDYVDCFYYSIRLFPRRDKKNDKMKIEKYITIQKYTHYNYDIENFVIKDYSYYAISKDFCEHGSFFTFKMKVKDFISYDVYYNLNKMLNKYNDIIQESGGKYNFYNGYIDRYLNPEELYEEANELLKVRDSNILYRKYLPFTQITENTPVGYYFNDYEI